MPFFYLLLATAFNACTSPSVPQEPAVVRQAQTVAMPRRIGAIPLPPGYVRIPATNDSYAGFLRNLPLKADPTVYLYNGQKKRNQQAQYAVLDIDAGTKDLQQCADAVMRLRAEYLYARQQYDAISFRFTNGFYCDYAHYAGGYRPIIRGNSCTWALQQSPDHSRKGFRQYLDLVYTYAGTQSLHAQLKPAPFTGLAPGQVLIQTRQPYGHAVTVMDMACNPQTKDTVFLLAQSYMPAQDMHILRNPSSTTLSPWYSVHFEGPLDTPEWTFSKEDLRTF